MSEYSKPLHVNFSTADADDVRFALNRDHVDLDFIDWQERPVHVVFENPVGIRWQENEATGGERNDSVYEIIDSEWLLEYFKTSVEIHREDFHHFKLCFNAWGVLEVLATGINH